MMALNCRVIGTAGPIDGGVGINAQLMVKKFE